MLPALSTRRFSLPTLSTSNSLRREMDELFDRFFGDFGSDGMTRGWFAPVAIWDDAEHVYLECEVPGVGKDDLEVVVQDGTLRITGERKMPEGDRQYWHTERQFGRFERIITLPETVDAESIDAEMHDGVLRVCLTKKPEAQPKRVAIKAG